MDECVRSADREDFTAEIIAPPTTHFTWNCRSIWFRTTSSVDTFSRSVDFNIILYFKVGLEHRSELLAVFGNYPPLSGLCSQLVISRRTFSHHYHLGILGLHTPHIKCELRRVGPRWVVRGLPVDVARSGLPGTIVVGLPRCLVVYVLGIEAGAAAGESVKPNQPPNQNCNQAEVCESHFPWPITPSCDSSTQRPKEHDRARATSCLHGDSRTHLGLTGADGIKALAEAASTTADAISFMVVSTNSGSMFSVALVCVFLASASSCVRRQTRTTRSSLKLRNSTRVDLLAVHA
ncbi:hypothetical protein THAOC_03540, partial [Thalassiosira oceanica]